MRVTVRVVGHAVEFFPGGKDRYDLEFDGPTDVAGIIGRLGVGRALVMTAIAGGKRRDFSYVPADGEEIVLMTPPAGG